MWQIVFKVSLTAVVVVAVSEIAKRNSFWAAILASLPLTSLLALVWLYIDTKDAERVASLSSGIFWLVIPSLLLFLLLPWLLRSGWNFWASLLVSCAATVFAYIAMVWFIGRLRIQG